MKTFYVSIVFLCHIDHSGKRIKRGEHYDDYLFKSGKWVVDDEYVIPDHLIGFDPSEPEDSPYRIGSTSVMMEMEEISEEKAISSIPKLRPMLCLNISTNSTSWNWNPENDI